jgi:hydrogenase nickel incorporation protein HypA/HybF
MDLVHELAATHSLLQVALRHAQNAGARRISGLYLVIGELSSIIDDSVAFYWDMVSQDTIAEGATLHFRRVATEMMCLECQRRYAPEKGDLACPDCRGDRVRVVDGDQFLLESIDIEN